MKSNRAADYNPTLIGISSKPTICYEGKSIMAKEPKESKETTERKETSEAKAPAPEPSASELVTQSVNLQLLPANGSDQPVLANVTIVQPTVGVTLVDFGFLDPGAMTVLTNIARAGMKVPERINGRLAARVAMSYEALAALHQQLGA